MLYLGADHRGYKLKEEIMEFLDERGIAFEDLGAYELDPDDDHPVFAHKVSEAVAKNLQEHKGILICGSGVGISVAANKEKGIICGLFFSEQQAKDATEHDHVNVAALSADFTDVEEAKKIVGVFLKTDHLKEERYLRRNKQIRAIKEEQK
jgi:ribose 5-phosphate isomerase B